MEGFFVLNDGTVLGRIPNTTDGSLVGLPREGEIVCIKENLARKVISLRWWFKDVDNTSVDVVLGEIFSG